LPLPWRMFALSECSCMLMHHFLNGRKTKYILSAHVNGRLRLIRSLIKKNKRRTAAPDGVRRLELSLRRIIARLYSMQSRRQTVSYCWVSKIETLWSGLTSAERSRGRPRTFSTLKQNSYTHATAMPRMYFKDVLLCCSTFV